MESWREDRFGVRLPVEVRGTDKEGRQFVHNTHTLDISRGGARLESLAYLNEAGPTIQVRRGPSRAPFRVIWVGQAETRLAGQVGVAMTPPAKKPIWGIRLPRLVVPPELTEAQPAAPMPPLQRLAREYAAPQPGTKVLILDDDPDIVVVLGKLLQAANYEIHTAGDGNEGMDLIRAQRPALVLLDLMMPGKHGFTICQEVQSDPGLKDVRVLVLSAKAYPLDIRKAKQLGAVDYLVKPYEPEDLLAKIKTVLTSPNGEPAGAASAVATGEAT